MSRLVTLLQLRTDIADQADLAGFVGASERFTPTQLNRYINQSINRFREKISSESVTSFLTSANVTIGPGATSPYAFFKLDLSSLSPGLVRSYIITIAVNGIHRRLTYVPFMDLAEYGGPNFKGVPTSWSHFAQSQVAIFPAPDTSYSGIIWYLPVLTDLSSDNDTFDGVSGWEDYIVWDVVLRLIVKNQYPEAYQVASGERDRIWRDIVNSATKVSNAGGAVVGRDSLGERMRTRIAGKGLLPPP